MPSSRTGAIISGWTILVDLANLTAAALWRRVQSWSLGNANSCELLGCCWMNSNGGFECPEGQVALNSRSKTLDHFSSVGTDKVHSNNLLVAFSQGDYFHVTMFDVLLGYEEFGWFVVGMIDLDVVFPMGGNGLLLAEADATVFQRAENGRRDVCVVHQVCSTAKQSPGEQFTGVNRNWSEFRFFLYSKSNTLVQQRYKHLMLQRAFFIEYTYVKYVANSVDVWNIGLFVNSINFQRIWDEFKANVFGFQLLGESSTSDSEKYSIVSILMQSTILKIRSGQKFV